MSSIARQRARSQNAFRCAADAEIHRPAQAVRIAIGDGERCPAAVANAMRNRIDLSRNCAAQRLDMDHDCIDRTFAYFTRADIDAGHSCLGCKRNEIRRNIELVIRNT